MVTCTVSPIIPPLVERGLYCNHLVHPLVCLSVCSSVHTFVKDVSASTGRNDFIFDMWLWHGDLYRVSPFHVYCTSTSCLPCDLRIFHVFTSFSCKCWDIYKFDTNERVGVFLARRSVQLLVSATLYNKKIVISMLYCYCHKHLIFLCFLWHWHHGWCLMLIRYIHLRSLSRRITHWVVGDSFYNTIFEFYTRW
jgi:hypothetical protein